MPQQFSLGLLNLAEDITWIDSSGNSNSVIAAWWSVGTYVDPNTNETKWLMYKVWPDPVAYSSIKVVRVRDLNGTVTDLSSEEYNSLESHSVLCKEETSGYVVFGLINYDGNSKIGNVTRAIPLYTRISNDVLNNGNPWFTLQDIVWNNPWTDLNGSKYTKITVKQNITLNSDSTTNFVGVVNVDGGGSAITYNSETGLSTGGSGIWGNDDTFNIKAGSVQESCSFGNSVTTLSGVMHPSLQLSVNMTEVKTYYDDSISNTTTISGNGTGIATANIGNTSLDFNGGYGSVKVSGQDTLYIDIPLNDTGSARTIDINVQGLNSYVHHINQDPFITYEVEVGSTFIPTQPITLNGRKTVKLYESYVVNPQPSDYSVSATPFTMSSSNTSVAIVDNTDNTVSAGSTSGTAVITVTVNGEDVKTFRVSVSITSLYMKIYKGSTEIASSSNPGQIGTGNTLSGPYNMNLGDGTLVFNFYTDSSCNNQVSGSMTTDSTDNDYIVPNNVNVVGSGSSITVITYPNSDIGQYEFPVLLDGIRLGCIWGNIIA